MPKINQDMHTKTIHLSAGTFKLFILILGLNGTITREQLNLLKVPVNYITYLKYLGLVYKKGPGIWSISSYGYRFVQGMPCATKVSVLNQETFNEENKRLFVDLIQKYIKEIS